MKKFYGLLIMVALLLSFNVTLTKEVKADVFTDIVWTIDTGFSPFSLHTEVQFSSEATEVSILMPSSEYHIEDSGTYIFNITFYDTTHTQIWFTEGQELFGATMSGTIGGDYTYTFNLERLGVEDAEYIEITYPQTFTAIPAGYLDIINAESTVTINYNRNPFGTFEFKLNSFIGDAGANAYDSDLIPVPEQTEFISLESVRDMVIRIKPRNPLDETFNSLVYFYDENEVLLDTLKFNEILLASQVLTGTFKYNIPLIDVDNYEDVAFFSILRLEYQATPAVLNEFNDQTFFDFDGEGIRTVNYMSEGELFETFKIVTGSILYPRAGTPTSDDITKVFSYWILSDGTQYTDTPIKETQFISGVLTLYAHYEDLPDPIVGPVTDPDVDPESLFVTGLNYLGFDEPIGRTIVFAFTVMVTAILMMWRKISMVAVMVVVSLELAFFMYLGLLPLFVSIILILVLAVLGWSLRGSVSSE